MKGIMITIWKKKESNVEVAQNKNMLPKGEIQKRIL